MGKKPEAPATEAPAEQYPFLREPAVAGGIVLRNGEDYSITSLTAADIAAANDEMFTTSQNLRAAQGQQKQLLEEETRIEGDLKAVRAALRKNEETRLSLGDELAVFAEQIHTAERKVSIKTTHTLTPGNELVITDARDGREIERRTATREELDLASERTASMQTLGGKLNPQYELVTVSVDSKAFNGKAGKRLASHMSEVQPDTDDIDAEPYPVAWLQADDSRSAAVVPRWVASRLRTIAGDRAEAIGFSVAERQ